MIRMVHRREGHAGAKHDLCQMRKKYWIIQGLREVQKVIKTCVQCQKATKAPLQQRMAPLPMERVSMTGPFNNTGVAMMGPFLVKMNGRSNHKVYVAVFTCMESRSVHAEVTHKMDAGSIMMAISRFIARRPGVSKFFSDRGTNFIAANSIMTRELRKMNEEAQPELRKRGIEWSFNPPYAPHRGGVWERIIGMFKKHLSCVMNGEVRHLESFSTIITNIEGILNRRPLTAISTDSRDSEALTPNHLLAPASIGLNRTNYEATMGEAEGTRGSWERAQDGVNAFWKKWKEEYLSLLHQRSKWRGVKDNLKRDDIVIMTEDGTNRNEWSLGRVTEVKDADGHVRTVEVRTSGGKTTTRDRTRLVKLEMDG